MSGVNNIRSSVISPTNGILPTLIIDFWVNIIVKRTLRNGKREGNFIHFIFTYIYKNRNPFYGNILKKQNKPATPSPK
jgi:hypothetical protein